jgi:hypothetical protein
VLEEQRRQRRFQQCGEDVAVLRETLQLVGRDVGPAIEQPLPEVELASDDCAAGARDDVRADLRQAPFRVRRIPLVQRVGDGELEDAVAEELEPLVRDRALGRPRGVRVDLICAVRWQRFDEALESLVCPRLRAIGARRRSRRPGRRW